MNQFKTFAEASLPPEPDIETEGEKHVEQLKQSLAWFYQRGINVIIKPTRTGYALTMQQPQSVVVERKW